MQRKTVLRLGWLGAIAMLAISLSACQQLAKPIKNWRVASNDSRIYLVTTKKLHVAEVMQITGLSGHYDGQRFTLKIDLNRINSGIPVRDERMRKHLFETAQYNEAVLQAELPLASLNGGKHSVQFQLALHGKQQQYQAQIWVSQLPDNKRLISLAQPILIRAEDFGLKAGIDMLAKLAKLANISYTVPVTAEIVLEPAKIDSTGSEKK